LHIQSITHPTFLMPWEPKLLLRNVLRDSGQRRNKYTEHHNTLME